VNSAGSGANVVTETKKSDTVWPYDFVLDGTHTLDENIESQRNHILRIRKRRELFFDPLITSGFLRGKRILDLGSSAGYWGLMAITEGQAEFVQAVDALPTAVEKAKDVFASYGVADHRYNICLADAYQFLEAHHADYDVILCLGFLYHVRDPYRLIKLMHEAAREIVVIDTLVHNTKEALISVRPVRRKTELVQDSALSLELHASPKALYWMANEAGFKVVLSLSANFEQVGWCWDYWAKERRAFVLSKIGDVSSIYPARYDEGFLTPSEDLDRYGIYPEMKPRGRQSA
jgi:2-polyprenyl-3-methyl-5-hydroxy-6-metoxy-1,4-benzoquinol methylase